MKVLYKRPSALQDTYFKYCGGCGHAIINKLIAEIIDEKKCLEDTVMVWPIGCSVYADQYFRTDSICALHGRAPALATGLKRAEPDKLIIVYQGDGDMVSEGMSEIIHAAIRGEKFSVIFVNNAIYGMTGGQMAPTTLEGQTTTTTPYGRKKEVEGAPVNMAELISNIKGCIYSERVAVNTPGNIMAAKRAIKKAIDLQMDGKGMSFVEILSPCPTGWGMKPMLALDYLGEEMIKVYPLGIFKDTEVKNG
ncbi:MAG: 2-oxoglutarate oxidoreductase [Anaerotignum sp.]|jgi:2-oxoglutarate ferredoxin oxidoreductase subunit beta|nr:2-oxoglutarate oxidoreductase [Anaerotignum sp.]MCI8867704.1 2-oxoglutarate oxidoreductase [Anaerotignum sp.]